ncbi:MAG: glutamate racemase [Vampirovibrionales bacterium]
MVLVKQQKVLLIDSGIGGLSVLARLLEQATQNHIALEACYVADTAWFPYGERSRESLKPRVIALLETCIQAFQPDLIVIACNTLVSVTAEDFLPFLQSQYQVWDPIHAVCETLVKTCHHYHQQNITPPSLRPMGILATPLTASSGVYPRLLSQTLRTHELAQTWETLCVPVACSGLASWVENTLYHAFQTEADFTSLKTDTTSSGGIPLQEVLRLPFTTLATLAAPPKKILSTHPTPLPYHWVLGCTHYPLIQSVLKHAWHTSNPNMPSPTCLDPAETLLTQPYHPVVLPEDTLTTADIASHQASHSIHFRFTQSAHATSQETHHLEHTQVQFYQWVLQHYAHEKTQALLHYRVTGEAWVF